MMLDANIVAVSPSSVWRVLGQAGLLSKWNGRPSKKGTGFDQPLAAHQHWHIAVSYINISGTFYYTCTASWTATADTSSTGINWDLRESMPRRTSRSSCTGHRNCTRRHAPDHLRQRPAVYRQGLQGVY